MASTGRGGLSGKRCARKLTHQAALIGQADWQAITSQARAKWSTSPLRGLAVDGELLNPLRGLANVLADAMLWQHEQKDDVAAIETMQDLWRLAAAVQRIENTGSCLLTGLAIQDLDLERLEVVTSSLALTKDQHDAKSVQATTARELIGELMDHPDPKTEGANFNHVYGAAMKGAPASLPGTIVEIINSVDAERDLAAMSLACHLYRFETGQWPRSADDIGKYLPHMPIDPFGDGTQPLGYVLIKGGLPDGSDRPLVYSRHRMKGGRAFRVDRPEYSDYVGDGGQFRDVASWSPPETSHLSATTRPLN